MKYTYTYEKIKELIQALDIYSRFLCGHYDILFHHYHISIKMKLKQMLIDILNQDSSLGIWHEKTPLNAKRAYDIQQILRFQMAWHQNPNGGIIVDFNKPYIQGQWHKTNQFDWPCCLINFNDEKRIAECYLSDEAMQIINSATKLSELIKSHDIKKHIVDIFQLCYEKLTDEDLKKLKQFQKQIYK